MELWASGGRQFHLNKMKISENFFKKSEDLREAASEEFKLGMITLLHQIGSVTRQIIERCQVTSFELESRIAEMENKLEEFDSIFIQAG